ncbi:MAG: YHS domain-containing protein [Gemmataceae bacterium]
MRFWPVLIPAILAVSAQPPAPMLNSREGLQPLNVLVGTWKGTGSPEGVSKEERAAGIWTEGVTWEWAFSKQDAWLSVTFSKSKNFESGEVRFTKETPWPYCLSLRTTHKTTIRFGGRLTDKTLTFRRLDGDGKDEQQLVFSLLHHNRHLYRFETRPVGSVQAFSRKYQVGVTKEGVPFADVLKGPECLVSGGLGTSKVTFHGKDYYVCCSGCRDEFKANPEKYVKEVERKAKDGK